MAASQEYMDKMQLRQNYRNFWHTDLMGTIQADTPCILSLSLSLTFSLYKHRYTLFCIYVCMYVYGISFLLIRLCFSVCVFVQIAALRFFGKCYLDLLNLNFELELVDLDCVVDFWVFEGLFWLWLGFLTLVDFVNSFWSLWNFWMLFNSCFFDDMNGWLGLLTPALSGRLNWIATLKFRSNFWVIVLIYVCYDVKLGVWYGFMNSIWIW